LAARLSSFVSPTRPTLAVRLGSPVVASSVHQSAGNPGPIGTVGSPTAIDPASFHIADVFRNEISTRLFPDPPQAVALLRVRKGYVTSLRSPFSDTVEVIRRG
jgi:hypothetical protein